MEADDRQNLADSVSLIEDAMADVRIVPCERCNGEGSVGLPSFSTVCPICHGRCVTTASSNDV